MGTHMISGINRVTGPLVELNPLESLSQGVLVSWRFTGRAVVLLGLCFPAGFWILGGWVLRRKELAR